MHLSSNDSSNVTCHDVNNASSGDTEDIVVFSIDQSADCFLNCLKNNGRSNLPETELIFRCLV